MSAKFIVFIFTLLSLYVVGEKYEIFASPGNYPQLKATVQDKRLETLGSQKSQIQVFKATLAKIKDENRRKLVEKINDNINQINTNRTDHFLKILGRLSGILDKLELQIEMAKQKGLKTAASEDSVTIARERLKRTEAEVVDQATKLYIIPVDLTSLKIDVGNTVTTLQRDLNRVKFMLIDAKQLTVEAFTQLKRMLGE